MDGGLPLCYHFLSSHQSSAALIVNFFYRHLKDGDHLDLSAMGLLGGLK